MLLAFVTLFLKLTLEYFHQFFREMWIARKVTFKSAQESSGREVKPEQLSRVQPLTVTQIALIERDLHTHTHTHTGIYVSNFIASCDQPRCGAFMRTLLSRTRIFACTRLDSARLSSTRCHLYRETRNSRLLI